MYMSVLVGVCIMYVRYNFGVYILPLLMFGSPLLNTVHPCSTYISKAVFKFLQRSLLKFRVNVKIMNNIMIKLIS